MIWTVQWAGERSEDDTRAISYLRLVGVQKHEALWCLHRDRVGSLAQVLPSSLHMLLGLWLSAVTWGQNNFAF